MSFKSLAGALALASMWAAAPAHAQDFPTRTVRIISAFPAGSGPDAAARVLAQTLARYWGQQVIVDPRPGGSGFIAAGAVKNSAPDGHDLLITDDGQITINPSLYKKMSFDVERDFDAAAAFFRTPFFIAVAANGPITTAKDLTALASANPDTVSFGSPRIGSPSHLGGALYAMLTNTKMLHVPFTETTQLFTAVASGDVTWGLGTVATTGALVRSGKVRLIAVAAEKRVADQPDIPTVVESGGPAGFEVTAWVGFLARQGTPKGTLDKINRDIQRALREPELQVFLGKVGYEPVYASRDEFIALIRSDTKKNAERVARAGAKAE